MNTEPLAPSATAAVASAELGTERHDRPPALLEYVGVIAFFALSAVLAVRIVQVSNSGQWIAVAAAVFAGYVLSDFVSGFVHWTFDTWGSPNTPFFGKAFIHHFRWHHVDPKDITRHGFIATNGNNCLAATPALVASLFIPVEASWAPAAIAFIVSLCLGVFATNQFHKWAHADKVSPLIAWAQRAHLILGVDHHDVHHRSPYESHYCITTGWLNRPLMAVGFFRGMEKLITAVTGAQPRKDDLKQ